MSDVNVPAGWPTDPNAVSEPVVEAEVIEEAPVETEDVDSDIVEVETEEDEAPAEEELPVANLEVLVQTPDEDEVEPEIEAEEVSEPEDTQPVETVDDDVQLPTGAVTEEAELEADDETAPEVVFEEPNFGPNGGEE